MRICTRCWGTAEGGFDWTGGGRGRRDHHTHTPPHWLPWLARGVENASDPRGRICIVEAAFPCGQVGGQHRRETDLLISMPHAIATLFPVITQRRTTAHTRVCSTRQPEPRRCFHIGTSQQHHPTRKGGFVEAALDTFYRKYLTHYYPLSNDGIGQLYFAPLVWVL